MKKLLFYSAIAVTLFACSPGNNGELVGVIPRPSWYQNTPYGMLYIPAGSYNMGASDQDVPWAHTNRSKTVSVQAFYMDQTEISNNEYRQFVYYVRDSIARRKLAEEFPEEFLMPRYDDEGNELDASEWDLNWSARLKYFDPDYMPLLSEMYLPDHERYYRRKEFDVRKLMFEYYWIDLQAAAKKGRYNIKTNPEDPEHRTLSNPEDPITKDPVGRDLDLGYRNKKGQNNAIRGHTDRSRFIIKEIINVYPDTLCWISDFTYSFNDPMTNMYFWHPAYDEYPVVGVTWVQAKAFCVWRTQLLNFWLESMGEFYVQDFRLPTEAEWEYGARGGLDLSPYPWGGPYIRNARGCFLGNFKPMRGRYMEDGGFHTVKVTSYHPNDFGLYCMAGNVSEWCETAYDESNYEIIHDLNPERRYDALDHDPPAQKRKVIRGGSWKDIAYYLQTGSRSFEYQDSAKSYVGYRCVMTYLGRGGPDQAEEAR
ncbi:MAG TPA: gliding motility-associated lipoprotein [Flavobacteriales bacterium]|nr:gliding motility-associated lipoprotein [Flavobacteriales bacterium]HCA83771.1 gliding motility-associated lipoprotein [Flavobacteriales bacterium]HRE73288.1 SUMF1/EgtB/PvdO family nonheme iron enzyme [Flavobacteriales bacterium]HRJ35024.1 SUMF1/EgtB/PvdO family nonheme iron enzyme [Flavobacteriales bacterium]